MKFVGISDLLAAQMIAPRALVANPDVRGRRRAQDRGGVMERAGTDDSSTMAAMQFDVTQDFPAGLERLWSALGRADYVRKKYRSLGSTSLHIRKFSCDAELIEVEIDRQAAVARDALPFWARAFSKKRQAMRHHTRWTRVGRDRVEVELEVHALGLPVRALGTGSIVERVQGHSRMTLRFHISSSAGPLSTSVARAFAQQVRHALHADHAFTLGYLEANPDP